ncbi:MAG: sigma-54-dependent Fis family transcriptional regulator [Anaerolineaceae bacterium]|nr:MAG: sigma-54-dependent Fis family transcriptional regulator [Anaerolineaceae bacterium]
MGLFSILLCQLQKENKVSFTVLIVDDEENARKSLSVFLKSKNFEVFEAGTIEDARKQLKIGNGDIILLDVQLPDGYGQTLLRELQQLQNKPPVILITGFGDIEMAVDAMRNGAHDFLTKPITDFKVLENSIARACELIQMRREIEHYRQKQLESVDFVLGSTEKMKNVVSQALKASRAMVSVLITGETGTGKEILARFIHKSGPRATKQFVAINCAAIQPTLLESELFGHDPGGYTDAKTRKHGLMEIADDGILFLDEISSMPLEIQAKLLRAIEEKAFRRVGGTDLVKVDVQILAASNRNLKELIKESIFREDLYYRLKVVDLDLPPLRERKNDIPEFVGFFIKELNPRLGLNVIDVTTPAMDVLMKYAWPGNIRELRNTIERAMLFCDGEKIDIPDLPLDLIEKLA